MAEEIQANLQSTSSGKPQQQEAADTTEQQETSSPPPSSPAHHFPLYGWRPDPTISDDENYLDVVMLITRSVQGDGQQGHMGALIVRQKPKSNNNSSAPETVSDQRSSLSLTSPSSSTTEYEDEFYRNILGAATNTPLFGGKDVTSDIHAEINALGQACKSSQSTQGCTAYITIHPCKRCFAALVTFGISRIVCRRQIIPLICETAAERRIGILHLTYEEQNRQMQRINKLLNKDRSHEELMKIADTIQQNRKERKLAQKLKKKEAAATKDGEKT